MPEQIGLRIGEDLSFPPDVVTETLLIIAKRGSGKTHRLMVVIDYERPGRRADGAPALLYLH